MEKVNLNLINTDEYFMQEAFKVLRTNLQFCGQDVKVIAITSTNENEGKTTVSLNLAKSFAELGKKVLYIDADMRKSVTVGRYTDGRNLDGLSEVLSGQRQLSACVYSCQFPNLNMIFAGHYPPNPAELLGKKVFAALVAEARKHYEYIIIDTPPLGRVIDAAVVAACCDGIALIIGGKKTNYHEALAVVDQLRKSGCTVLGAIRNNVPVRNSKYYKS